MTLSLRQRILLTVAPLVLLLLLLGTGAVLLLLQLGRQSSAILRENYESVRAMNQLRLASHAVEQATTPEARAIAWARLDDALEVERENLTILPREADLFAELESARNAFHRGESRLPLDVAATAIHDLNEAQMSRASQQAQETARASVLAVLVALVVALVLAGLAVWWLHRVILGPIRSVTRAAQSIESGQMHLLVPVHGNDELARLAEAFNAMTRTLRAYRQSDMARLLRARQVGQATIDSFPDPIIVLDLLGGVEFANPAAQRLLGVQEPNDANAAPPWQPPEVLRQAVADALRQQRATLTESFDQTLTYRLDGEDRQYLPQVRPIRSAEGETLGAAVLLTDVTRFRLLDQLKSDWVATVSHELKTPLTSVRLAVHVLLEEVVGPLEPRQTELLLEARDSTERLLRLIEYLLALARLEDGREQLHSSQTSPGNLLRTAADTARSRAEDRHITLTVNEEPDLPPVEVDLDRFGQALNNLLDNALTYTEAGGTITLSAEAKTPNGVCLTVCDTGMGIPAEYLPHVFDRFFRVPGREQPAGTGLGLAIVREIVTAHHGQITCESRPGQGTTFRITLPTAKENA